MKTPTHAFLGTALALVVPLCCVLLSTSTPGASAASSSDPVVIDESFASRTGGKLFRTSGPGKWKVSDGGYRMRVSKPLGDSDTTRARTLLRKSVTAQEWTMRATVDVDAGGYSVIYAYDGTRDYSYVHLDQRPGRSGLFEVRRGKVSRIAGLAGGAPTDGRQTVSLRRVGTQLSVHLGAENRPAATLQVPSSQVLRPGFASRHTDFVLDHLTITTPAPTTTKPAPSSSPTPSPTSAPTPSPAPPATPSVTGRAVTVSTSAQLTAALAGARPGDVITMADGTYTSKSLKAPLVIGGKQYAGTFVASVSGTATAPIVLQGSRRAVIDGKPGGVGTGTQYGLYLAGADHVRVSGITITNVAKGVVLDRTKHAVLEGLSVHTTGEEAIHLRSLSSDNVVRNNVVTRTGLTNDAYGEGIYVGSAHSNWATYSGGRPDASDRNRILDNVISQTGAESIDVKEGTTGGTIRGNRFDGAGMTGSYADSWIDLKGNGWLVESNHGVNAVADGFQVHQALAGWGNDNVFRTNVAEVNGPGYGFWVQKGATGNRFVCTTNTVRGAASGFANVACSPTA